MGSRVERNKQGPRSCFSSGWGRGGCGSQKRRKAGVGKRWRSEDAPMPVEMILVAIRMPQLTGFF